MKVSLHSSIFHRASGIYRGVIYVRAAQVRVNKAPRQYVMRCARVCPSHLLCCAAAALQHLQVVGVRAKLQSSSMYCIHVSRRRVCEGGGERGVMLGVSVCVCKGGAECVCMCVCVVRGLECVCWLGKEGCVQEREGLCRGDVCRRECEGG